MATMPTIDLSKGQNIDLSKAEPGLETVRLCLGWEPRIYDGEDFDLDASCFLLNRDNKVRDASDFVYHKNLVTAGGAVEHLGDNLTGAGTTTDKEQIRVALSRLPADVDRLAIVVAIHDAVARRQSFGQVDNAFIRVVNDETGREVARYDLTEESSAENALVMGELYRRDSAWKFRSVEQGFAGKPGDISGLAEIVRMYGLNVK